MPYPRPINLDCPEERAVRDHVLNEDIPEDFCDEFPPDRPRFPYACTRPHGHTGPHIATSGGARLVQARWIEEEP